MPNLEEFARTHENFYRITTERNELKRRLEALTSALDKWIQYGTSKDVLNELDSSKNYLSTLKV
jgi:chromosome segregation ATPase